MIPFRSHSTGIRLSIALVLAAATVNSTQAALPPLSPAELQSRSDTIVKGTVTQIRSRVTTEGDFVDEDFYIDVAVDQVEKGQALPGQNVTFTTWRPKRRPIGHVGPQGQMAIPKVGDVVQMFSRGTERFRFRRGNRGEETALVLLQPNGLSVGAPIPPSILGEWECRLKRDENSSVTMKLSIFPDGHYHEEGRVDEIVNGQPRASSSVSHGQAHMSGDRLKLADHRTLMILRDGRALVEGDYGAMVFVRLPGQVVPVGAGSGPDDPQAEILSQQAREFASFAGMTIEELPGGDLQVLSVTPNGSASRKGIRPGDIIINWSFESKNGTTQWSAEIR